MDQHEHMRSVRFRREREAKWKQLEGLVNKAETNGVRQFSFAEGRDLVSLYRQATTSLAIAREISLDRSLQLYLEGLTARAYLCVYAQQQPLGGMARRFITRSGPLAMRKSWLYVLVGFLCMALGVLVGYFLYLENTAWYYVFVPDGFSALRNPEATTQTLRSVIYDENPDSTGLGAFATHLFSHNTRIAIFVFGLGVFLCLPAIILTFYNGLLLGAFVALHVERGLGPDIIGWLSIHGVTELSAICIACGGGIQLGSAVLFPGRRRRIDALRIAGNDAVKLAIIAAMMLFTAAILEGFARQLVQDLHARLIIGWGIGLLWLSWFLFVGKLNDGVKEKEEATTERLT